jgi:hypothetical protein
LQFIQALVDNLQARFPEDRFLEDGENARALYGDQHVLHLDTLCHINAVEALSEFREYKQNRRRIGRTLQTLLQRLTLLPVSSAECERGFSCMNVNDTAVRNQLSVETLSALLFIKANGPPPSLFNPTPYVELWLQEGHHSSTDKPTGKESKVKDTMTSIASLFT